VNSANHGLRRVLVTGAEEGLVWEIPWASSNFADGIEISREASLPIEEAVESLQRALDLGLVVLYADEHAGQRELSRPESHAAVTDPRSWDPAERAQALTVVLTGKGEKVLREMMPRD
jgi:hypothetical protein